MKRKTLQPLPDTVWHSSGRVRNKGALQVIRQHLQTSSDSGLIEHWRDFTPSDGRWWWGFDAAWQTADGDRIKARLHLRPELAYFGGKKLSREDLEAKKIPMDLYWVLTAEADRPWDLNWSSPIGMLGKQACYDWTTGQMPLLAYSGFTDSSKAMRPSELQQAFQEFASCSSYITVLTHDRRPLWEEKGPGEPPLADLVPLSLRGRVLEFRFFGDQDRFVNADQVLPESRLRLKWGGALILPTRPRQEEWPLADYLIRRPPGGDMEQMLKEAAETVARHGALRPHFCDKARWGVEQLRESWELPEIGLASKRVLREKEQAEEEVERLGKVIVGLRSQLSAEMRHGQELAQEKQRLEQALKELQESPAMREAEELRAQASEAWEQVEAADEQAEKLAAEVGYLRRQLAQVPGRSYSEPVPERPDGPEGWTELFDLAEELLPNVRIDVNLGPVQKLRGHPSEKTWLRRAWEALEAYQAYADAKAVHGKKKLPHMHAYLTWQEATSTIPLSWYAAKESALERRDPKYAAMRNFPVPVHGTVCMEEHIRIGTGRAPAPRMYVFDDTSGPTGRVHVGYIGPHLPMGRSDN